MEACNISRVADADAVLVRCFGEVDMSIVPDLRARLESEIGLGCSNAVLDLSDVTYADSSALGLLVWLDQRVSPFGGRVVIAGANKDVSRILELSGLVSVADTISMSANADAAFEGLVLPEDGGEVLWTRDIPFVPTVDNLSKARHDVLEAISALGFPEAARFDISVALGEALANAIKHGAPLSGTAEVTITVSAQKDRAIIDVCDNGPGCADAASRETDFYAQGGRGIMFMHNLVDHVDFGTSPSGGTRVRLVKHRLGVA